jgi:hypothetical protein
MSSIAIFAVSEKLGSLWSWNSRTYDFVMEHALLLRCDVFDFEEMNPNFPFGHFGDITKLGNQTDNFSGCFGQKKPS